jgi:hypothetical protein
MYISISIDLAGSTDAKRQIRAIKAEDAELRRDHYRQLATKLALYEDHFYTQIFSPIERIPPPLDPARFFVVKTIGDEIWMLYELVNPDRPHIATAAARLLDSAFSLVNTASDLVATSQLEEPFFDPDAPPPAQVVSIPAELKVYMDLIDDCIEVSEVRQGRLLRRIGGYGRVPSTTPSFTLNPETAELIGRLNLGLIKDKKLVSRGDVIGFDVDRFFRTSKAAVAGIVTVGESLFAEIGLETRKVRANIHHGSAMIPANPVNPTSAQRRSSGIFCRPKTLPKKDLKGIGARYVVWRLASDAVVRAIHTRPQRSAIREARKVFPRDLVYPRKRSTRQLERMR